MGVDRILDADGLIHLIDEPDTDALAGLTACRMEFIIDERPRWRRFIMRGVATERAATCLECVRERMD